MRPNRIAAVRGAAAGLGGPAILGHCLARGESIANRLTAKHSIPRTGDNLRFRRLRLRHLRIDFGVLEFANDPHILRLLPPYILEEQHVDMLRDALRDLPA